MSFVSGSSKRNLSDQQSQKCKLAILTDLKVSILSSSPWSELMFFFLFFVVVFFLNLYFIYYYFFLMGCVW